MEVYEGFTEKQLKAIEVLMTSEGNISKAAREVGVSRPTIYNWLDNPRFKAEVEKREKQILDDVRKQFIRKLPQALEKLWELTDSTDKRARIEAIKYWVDRSLGKMSASIQLQTDSDTIDSFDIDAELKKIKSIKGNKGNSKVIPIAK